MDKKFIYENKIAFTTHKKGSFSIQDPRNSNRERRHWCSCLSTTQNCNCSSLDFEIERVKQWQTYKLEKHIVIVKRNLHFNMSDFPVYFPLFPSYKNTDNIITRLVPPVRNLHDFLTARELSYLRLNRRLTVISEHRILSPSHLCI